MNRPPQKIFRVGSCQASIFMNQIQKDGRTISLPKIVVQVRFKGKDGQWTGTNSLSLSDVPKAVLALQKAYEYLTCKGADKASGEDAPPIQRAETLYSATEKFKYE
ncbi:hypothetical protein COS91_06550 [Candidatus Desantisbacteria bacterium CG07_land_8_20_14_0_80_39_15]|uniref:Uncharacterized protein n=1 Tax=Candidatus Desantisbacteria bacterium CG07_land_8_20_14_0_80_39_15 TaxID=1974549 RepID=A0A2M6ZF85_9BACT|nr:MAG: hypothetical protein COS91_06550 [Candidatus Desantisbacteria bacterium CG07_land_8_20_14_0_80_39_15]